MNVLQREPKHITLLAQFLSEYIFPSDDMNRFGSVSMRGGGCI